MNIVFTGLSGVPYKKRAADARLLAFAETFATSGNEVAILNRMPVVNDSEKKDVTISADNIKIIELFKRKSPVSNSLAFVIYFLFSYLVEYRWFIKNNREKKIDFIHLYSGHYFDFLHYSLIAKLIGAKLIYQYVEVRTAKNTKGAYHKLNSYLVDNYGYRLFDGVISISDYISDLLNKQSSQLPVVKVPPICDISYFDNISSENKTEGEDECILFCGSAGYLEPIQLIIDSYKASKLNPGIKLYLVLSGTEQLLDKIRVQLTDSIKILNSLPYAELVKLYVSAKALLIPLRNTIEDTARFPNKISEYTASGGLIITTDFGEIKNYFKDNESALIAEDFTVPAYTRKLNQIVENSDIKNEEIRNNAYNICLKHFDKKAYKGILQEFLISLSKQK
ncbi:MAG: glycosyltransferase [Bacteroidia bacterium]|nr:glycosyltransferase [Bacteroidia bacterium]